MKKNSNLKIIIFYIVLFAVVILALSFMFNQNREEKVTYSQIVDYFKSDRVAEFVVDDDFYIEMKVYEIDAAGNVLTSGDTKTIGYQLQSLGLFVEDCSEYYKSNQNLKSYDIEPETVFPWWVAFLPYIIVIVVLVILFFAMKNSANAANGAGKMNSFGKARVKMPQNDKNKVLFSDVAGADEEKAELEEVVEFLKAPDKFSKLGAKIPHGVLLVGPPGTGKTLLAKAVAGEAGVPFFSISGSDFVEMYVGVGASRVRDLFETARKHPASIIFIDEIDAVGRHRGAGLGGGHDEREQTLNQLLVEMDGFGSHEGIIVIAATNRPDILDPALLRPGRFDRQITVNYPDIKGREEILKVHAKNKPFEENVDFAQVAKTTSGFTGADLANLLNEAALLSARRGKTLIGMEDIEDAFIRVIAGPKKKTRARKPEELRKTAYHEAGHAILAHLLPTQDPVQQISIIPSGNALGYTLNPPKEDKFSVYKNELKESIAMLLGGRAAEEIIFEDVSGGASNDIERATKIAKQMVTKLGMSDLLGLRAFGNDHGEVFLGRDFSSSQDYSDDTASKIDSEIHRIISEAYANAKRILTENMDKLHFVAEFLVRNEVMDGEQFAAAMDGNPTFEELEEMTEAKKRKSREENDRRRAELLAEERKRKEEEEKARKRAEEKAANVNHDSYDRGDDKDRYDRSEKDDKRDDDKHDGGDDSNRNIPF
ncbi:MAG: ATP-dependent zinc metalloprotease FtsH [Clostridia bacterium]|nr:ATP-dependent zinc metalloprotease FtsH [Clostridia bacterium]